MTNEELIKENEELKQKVSDLEKSTQTKEFSAQFWCDKFNDLERKVKVFKDLLNTF